MPIGSGRSCPGRHPVCASRRTVSRSLLPAAFRSAGVSVDTCVACCKPATVDVSMTVPPWACAMNRLLSHSDKDLVFSEGQHRAATRPLQVHDHAGAVLQPQIAAARGAQTGLAGTLSISARKIGNAGELVDGA